MCGWVEGYMFGFWLKPWKHPVWDNHVNFDFYAIIRQAITIRRPPSLPLFFRLLLPLLCLYFYLFFTFSLLFLFLSVPFLYFFFDFFHLFFTFSSPFLYLSFICTLTCAVPLTLSCYLHESYSSKINSINHSMNREARLNRFA